MKLLSVIITVILCEITLSINISPVANIILKPKANSNSLLFGYSIVLKQN